MSIEPFRTRAYHPDLRWRVVYQHYVQDNSVTTISKNLGIDKSTVRRVLKLFDSTSSVDKRVYSTSTNRKRLSSADELHILELVIENPGIYLSELKVELMARGTTADVSTICRFLKSSGFTRKNMRDVAIQCSEELRARYSSEVALYDFNMLVFIDETGSSRRDAMRKFGYSLRGQRCVKKRLLVRGERVSAIAALSSSGILDVKFVFGSVDGEMFSQFIELNLLPHLLPFNGINPNSIVVMDNASVHYNYKVAQLIRSVRALLVYLPPYSPDLNPIEEAFSAVKSFLKANEEIVTGKEDIKQVLFSAFLNITADDTAGWYRDSGYFT